MTSKEAIEIAKKAVIVAKQQRQNEADDEENEWFDSNIEALEQAEKDLEVLEIIKEKLKELCKLCEKEDIEQGHLKGCPFREISGDYCRLYELIIDELETDN